jgi:hypothetical protein
MTTAHPVDCPPHASILPGDPAERVHLPLASICQHPMAASSSSPASIGLEGELTALGALGRRIAPLLSAGSTQGEPPLVLVTALLDIHPPEVDRQFWQSATWRKSVRSLDMAYFGFVVTNNSALLLHRRRWPMEKFPFAGGFTALFLLLSFLQSYGAYRSHPLYHRARPTLVALNRCPPHGGTAPPAYLHHCRWRLPERWTCQPSIP